MYYFLVNKNKLFKKTKIITNFYLIILVQNIP